MRALTKQPVLEVIMADSIVSTGDHTCAKCLKTKPKAEFYASKNTKSGLTGDCKACLSERCKEYYKANKEKSNAASARWRALNPERNNELKKQWAKNNPEKVKAARRAWNEANPLYYVQYRASNIEQRKIRMEKYMLANRDRINKEARDSYDPATSWAKLNPEKRKATVAAYLAKNKDLRRVYEQNRRFRKRNGGKLSGDIVEKLLRLQNGKCPCCLKPLGDDYHLDHKMPLALGGSNTDDNMQLLRAECNLHKSRKHPIDFMQSRGFLL